MADNELALMCDCQGEVLGMWTYEPIDVDPEASVYMDIYTTVNLGTWRYRLTAIWKILRGKEYIYSGVCFTDIGKVRRIHEFLSVFLAKLDR